MNWANLALSVFGAALNLFLLSEEHHSPGLKAMFALLAVLLTLRAVIFGYKILAARTHEE